MVTLNTASWKPVLKGKREPIGAQAKIPAHQNCALCACAGLYSHLLGKPRTTSQTLAVMWNEIIEIPIPSSQLHVQQHAGTLAAFAYAMVDRSNVPGDAWDYGSDYRAEAIDRINEGQADGLYRFLRFDFGSKVERLEDRNSLPLAALDIKKRSDSGDSIYAIFLTGESVQGYAFGHWNVAYYDLRLDRIVFVDYQPKEAVHATSPVLGIDGNRLASLGDYAVKIVAANVRPRAALLPGGIPIQPAADRERRTPRGRQRGRGLEDVTRASTTAVKGARLDWR